MASLLFADDVAVLATTANELRVMLEEIELWAGRWEMSLGVPKCGIMVCEDRRLREDIAGQSWPLQGEEVPLVRHYKYLGVLLQDENTYGLSKFEASQAKRLETLINRLRPFLFSKSIPLKVRLRVWRTLVEPVARWGSELVGFNANHAPFNKVVKAYQAGIRILVGSASKNTIYSDLCLRQELGLPSFFELASMARACAVWKFPTLKTVMALLIEQWHTVQKRSWVTGSITWLKRYPGLDPAVLDLGGSQAAVGEVNGRCPRCMQEIAAPELEHVVLMCTAYTHQRQILRPILEAIPEMDNQAQTLQVILGGKGRTAGGGHFSLGAQWSGEAVQGLGDTDSPGFVPVAKFLGKVLPMQMGALWAWWVDCVQARPTYLIPILAFLRQSWDVEARGRSKGPRPWDK